MPVCIDINIGIRKGSFGKWKLGPCYNTYFLKPKSNNDGKPTLYTKRCCIVPGRYVLTCIGDPYTKKGILGWNGVFGFIEIQGHKYCEDSIIFNHMQVVHIVGK